MACNCQPTKPCDNSCKMNSKDVCYTGIDLTCIDIFPNSHTVENYLIKIDEILCQLLNAANVNYGILTLNANGQEVGTFAALGAVDTIFNINLDNIGLGAQVFKSYNPLTDSHELKSITKTGDLIVITENLDDIEITVDETELGDFVVENQLTYSAANVGLGASVYKDITIVGNNTQFNHKKLKSIGGTVTITEETDEINFEVEVIPSTDINITAGANVIVTEPTPNNFVISSTDNIALLENSATTTITGDGTLGNEYQVDVNNLQKVVNTFPYTLLNSDDKYTIFLENGVANVVINVPDTLVDNFSAAFVQKGTGDVTITPTGTSVINSALGYKIKGQYYWALLEKELSTVTYYLIGNTKL